MYQQADDSRQSAFVDEFGPAAIFVIQISDA